MKTIGLLGGTGWSSTIEYYILLNQLVHKKLGGSHSAKILLKSIDYHEIKTQYGADPSVIIPLLKTELVGLLDLKPDCFMICCNTLHKYYDLFKHELNLTIPIFHPIELAQKTIKSKGYKKVLFLATKFTMDDGFFSEKLKNENIAIVLPNQQERNEMETIHDALMNNIVTAESKNYFKNLTAKYSDCDAVVSACSEWGLVLHADNSSLPIIDTFNLQCVAAVEYAL